LDRFGEGLRIVRLHRGLEGREVAAAAGISPSYLSMIEGGKRIASARVAASLSRALAVDMRVVEMLPGALDDFVRTADIETR
jgi:transcriptional regulator with XRE-family HTH domain